MNLSNKEQIHYQGHNIRKEQEVKWFISSWSEFKKNNNSTLLQYGLDHLFMKKTL